MIVALPALLHLAGHIGAAMAALAGHDTFGLVGCLGQWAVFALAHMSLACLRPAPLATLLAKIVRRGRDVRVRDCLARVANEAPTFRNPRLHPLDHLVPRTQTLVVLSFARRMKREWGHLKGESEPVSPRDPFLPTP